MASGIKMSPECNEMFSLVKDQHKHGHAILMIKDEKEIVVEKSFDRHADKTPETSEQVFNEMREEILKTGGPRYILFDFSYYRKSGTSKDVVVYIYWCPDTIRVKDRMIYASTNEVLKKSFHGIKQFECHDEDEFSFKEIAERLEKSDRA